MPLDWLAAEPVVAYVPAGAAELVGGSFAGDFAGHSGADVAVAVVDVAELQLVAVQRCAERELELELANGLVVLPVVVFEPGLVVGGGLS